jgi:hypothetical protein
MYHLLVFQLEVIYQGEIIKTPARASKCLLSKATHMLADHGGADGDIRSRPLKFTWVPMYTYQYHTTKVEYKIC